VCADICAAIKEIGHREISSAVHDLMDRVPQVRLCYQIISFLSRKRTSQGVQRPTRDGPCREEKLGKKAGEVAEDWSLSPSQEQRVTGGVDHSGHHRWASVHSHCTGLVPEWLAFATHQSRPRPLDTPKSCPVILGSTS
jgi:hypothetical protein